MYKANDEDGEALYSALWRRFDPEGEAARTHKATLKICYYKVKLASKVYKRAVRLPRCALSAAWHRIRKGRVHLRVRSGRGLSSARGTAEAQAPEVAIDFRAR
jgi:hypothetical protein